MPIRLTVRSQIIDLGADNPTAADSFLVDTNVWLWIAYPSISQTDSPPLQYQLRKYSLYIQKAISAGSMLFRCGLSLAEIAHQIEQTEKTIYKASVADVPNKEYRHNLPIERKRVVGEIKTAWDQVKSMSSNLEISIDESTTGGALANLILWPLDGYDVFFLESMKKNNIRQIITDDGDFASIPDLQVFTANKNVIDAARSQGKLTQR